MPNVLTINGGSSSIRFAVYAAGDPLKKLMHGKLDRIGLEGTTLRVHETTVASETTAGGETTHPVTVDTKNRSSASAYLLDWLASQGFFADIGAVGHRVVHGMQHAQPERVTAALLAQLKGLTPYDPEHLPREIELIEGLDRKRPGIPQVACFDTAFHRSMPRVATIIPIPRRYEKKGIQRYGFHGLSYTYLMAELRRLGDAAATRGRVILAHLGNGASLAAVRDGLSVDTSMAFTPTAGLIMSSRSGDLDPGVMVFLATTESMSAAAYQKMVNYESGLLGVSETSSDIRDLLAVEGTDVRAAEAVEVFCYQVKKWIGSFAAVLGGVDTLVFAGGIGENCPAVRERICRGLTFVGIELDQASNAKNMELISKKSAHVAVRIIRTDEESVIASSTIDVLKIAGQREG